MTISSQWPASARRAKEDRKTKNTSWMCSVGSALSRGRVAPFALSSMLAQGWCQNVESILIFNAVFIDNRQGNRSFEHPDMNAIAIAWGLIILAGVGRERG